MWVRKIIKTEVNNLQLRNDELKFFETIKTFFKQ